MREKLIELLCKYSLKQQWILSVGDLASFLIANGVTFATDNNVGDKWIPVTERLPEEDGQYIVFRDYEKLPITQCGYTKNLRALSKWDFAWLHKDVGGFYGYDSECGYHEVCYVTHWMPLPEPPKEGVTDG